MNDCIFCKIVAGEMPASKVYEDDSVLAFMDIGPIVEGHTLVIPKQHCDPITDVPPDLLSKVILVAKKIAAAQLKGLGADGVNLHQCNGAASGQEVPHLHFHVIPRYHNDGHHWNWNPKSYSDSAEMDRLAEKISAEIEDE